MVFNVRNFSARHNLKQCNLKFDFGTNSFFFAWPMVDFDQEKHKTTFVLGCLGTVLFFSHLCYVEDLIEVYVLYAYIARQI